MLVSTPTNIDQMIESCCGQNSNKWNAEEENRTSIKIVIFLFSESYKSVLYCIELERTRVVPEGGEFLLSKFHRGTFPV